MNFRGGTEIKSHSILYTIEIKLLNSCVTPASTNLYKNYQIAELTVIISIRNVSNLSTHKHISQTVSPQTLPNAQNNKAASTLTPDGYTQLCR